MPLSFCWLLAGLALLLAGCAPHLPLRGPWPEGLAATHLGRIAPGALLAVSSDGRWLALGDNGVVLRATDGVRSRRLSTQTPVALAFDAEATQLLATFVEGEQTRVQRFAVADGALQGELATTGQCGSALWHAGEWLLLCNSMENFKFGTNLRSRLLRWNGATSPREEPIHDATLDPATVRQWGGQLAGVGQPQLSPYGDELLYLKLIDPPAFPPYRRAVLRHLTSGAEQPVANLNMAGGMARYAASGEEILYGDGSRRTVLRDPWSNHDELQYDSPGRVLAVSVAGRYLWIDDRLLRDGVELARFDAVAAAQFGPGGILLLRADNALWLLRGLDEPPAAPLLPEEETDRQRQLQLRQWRSSGLIDHTDYLQQRGER